jgi:hypothetical protein
VSTTRRPGGPELGNALRADPTVPAPARSIMLALLQYHYDWKKRQVIKPPSLTELQQETGLSRTTVRDHRYWLETHGWVTCTPPPVDLSRREHARTAYELHLPDSDLMTEVRAGRPAELDPAARRARLAAYVRDRARAKAAEAAALAAAAGQDASRVIPTPEVGRGRRARGARAPDWTRDPDILAAAADELNRQAGRVVDPATVIGAVAAILAGRSRADVRNPAVYVATSIRKDPRRFLPTPAPPPVPRTPEGAPLSDKRRREILAAAGMRRPQTA